MNDEQRRVFARIVVLSTCLILLLSGRAIAQEASISGRVLRRGVVPMAGARVSYTNAQSGAVYETVCDDSGRYRLDAMVLAVEPRLPQAVVPESVVAGSGGSSVRFYLRSAGPLREVIVYDVLGRRVASVPLSAVPAGGVWLADGYWDGRTEGGVPTADGVYFARAEGQRTLKFLRLRSHGAAGGGSAPVFAAAPPPRRAPTLDDVEFTVAVAPAADGPRFVVREFTRVLFEGENDPVTDSVGSAAAERVLFVGNSYTYYNNGLDGHLQAMAQAAHPAAPFAASRVAEPGYTLEDHWSSTPTRNAIASAEWDVVVLQEQSLRPITEPARMYEYARRLDGEILAAHAETAFFMTWARENRPGMADSLADAYNAIGLERGAVVAPVGLAWQRARDLEPTIELYDADGSHPSALGTYLACYVFFAALLQESPVGVAYPEDGVIPDSTRTLLQSVAWETVTDIQP